MLISIMEEVRKYNFNEVADYEALHVYNHSDATKALRRVKSLAAWLFLQQFRLTARGTTKHRINEYPLVRGIYQSSVDSFAPED